VFTLSRKRVIFARSTIEIEQSTTALYTVFRFQGLIARGCHAAQVEQSRYIWSKFPVVVISNGRSIVQPILIA